MDSSVFGTAKVIVVQAVASVCKTLKRWLSEQGVALSSLPFSLLFTCKYVVGPYKASVPGGSKNWRWIILLRFLLCWFWRKTRCVEAWFSFTLPKSRWKNDTTWNRWQFLILEHLQVCEIHRSHVWIRQNGCLKPHQRWHKVNVTPVLLSYIEVHRWSREEWAERPAQSPADLKMMARRSPFPIADSRAAMPTLRSAAKHVSPANLLLLYIVT